MIEILLEIKPKFGSLFDTLKNGKNKRLLTIFQMLLCDPRCKQ